MSKRPRAKLNIPVCVAGVLLCLTLFSAHLTSGLYARYITTASGEDGARVAIFDITDDGAYFSDQLLVESAPGEEVYKPIRVINNSEVTVAYVVTITNTTGNIPYLFSVDESTPVSGVCTVTCQLAPGAEKLVEISASWSVDGALEYMGMVDLVKITIVAQQVD